MPNDCMGVHQELVLAYLLRMREPDALPFGAQHLICMRAKSQQMSIAARGLAEQGVVCKTRVNLAGLGI